MKWHFYMCVTGSGGIISNRAKDISGTYAVILVIMVQTPGQVFSYVAPSSVAIAPLSCVFLHYTVLPQM